MGWRRSGREREEGEEARAGRAEGWKEGPEEEPGRQESPRWARSTLGRSPRRRGRSLTKGLEPSFLGLLPSLLSISAAPSPCLRLSHTKAKCPPSSEAIAAVALRARPSCAFSAQAAHSRASLCDPPAAADRPAPPSLRRLAPKPVPQGDAGSPRAEAKGDQQLRLADAFALPARRSPAGLFTLMQYGGSS